MRAVISIILLLCLTSTPAIARENRKWETLNSCVYVANKSNDGDSFHLRCGTNSFFIRLYFVDTPESKLTYAQRTQEQSVYFGSSLDATLKAGEQATQTVQELLKNPFVVRTRRANAAGRSRESRYYAFVEFDGKDLGQHLVALGLARNKGLITNLPDGTNWKVYADQLETLENQARQKHLGAWANTAIKK